MTRQPILLRLDGGNDSIENVDVVLEFNQTHPEAAVDFLIRWNPRRKDVQPWLEIAEQQATWEEPRLGKCCRVQGIFAQLYRQLAYG